MTALTFDWDVASCLEFEMTEYRNRWQRLVDNSGEECDVVIASSPENLRYFCGYRSLITRSRWRPLSIALPTDLSISPFFCVPEQDVGIARGYTAVEDICVVLESVRHGHDDPVERLATEIVRRGLGEGRIGLEEGFGQRPGMTLAEVERLRALLPNARFVDAAAAIWKTRAKKSPPEIASLRRACEITCNGVRAGFEQAHAGMSEAELHQIMRLAMIELGAEDVWLALGSGSKGYGVFNSYPCEIALQPGDLIWVDGGAYYNGYVCDFIRSAVIGEPSAAQVEWYSDALEANRIGVDQVKDGARCGDIFQTVREFLESAGKAGSWGLDILGHGVGLEIHELPSIRDGSDVSLEVGNVVTVEPSLSPPRHEHGHYIIEEVVAIAEHGAEVLTAALEPDLWIANG